MPALVGVVLLAAAGTGGWIVYDRFRGPLPPPPEPWPNAGGFTAFLCAADSPFEHCDGKGITDEQRRAVEAAIRAMPEVTSFEFESRAEAYATFLEQFKSDLTLGTVAEESDMPESFRGESREVTKGMIEQMKALPGVSQVLTYRRNFWKGKADLMILLCARKTEAEESKCRGRGVPSESERTAVYQRLRSIDGVGSIYFQDAAHYAKHQGIFFSFEARRSPSGTGATAFHVVLDDRAAAQVVKAGLARMPGVEDVVDERQW
ncbi:permease-like cell division protein FtsX [Nonomuraea sp. NPDC046570]|uniref:permease-like cell division protein FtsX n=1 Tax=Nonomuraea sp. NPDC046570 TaxID=3155255 RepID=UPI0033EA439F